MRRLALAALLGLTATPAFAALPVGAKAPDFTTRGARAGQIVQLHLKDVLRKGPVVLYFFPAAFTGGCNAEAHAFAEAIADFQRAGATVIGMSADTVPVLQRFSTEKCAGKFTVASAGPAVMTGYDVGIGHPVTLPDGSNREITSRTSYVIATDGRIAYAFADKDAAHHVENTLAAVRRLQAK